jgi:hypothetical protein
VNIEYMYTIYTLVVDIQMYCLLGIYIINLPVFLFLYLDKN